MEEEKKFKSNPVITGVGKIAVERQRQVREKGYTVEHDAQHSVFDLLRAAGAYQEYAYHAILNEGYPDAIAQVKELAADGWPWERSSYKPGSPEKALVKAGAMIAAALDLLEASKEAEEKAEAKHYRETAAQKNLTEEDA